MPTNAVPTSSLMMLPFAKAGGLKQFGLIHRYNGQPNGQCRWPVSFTPADTLPNIMVSILKNLRTGQSFYSLTPVCEEILSNRLNYGYSSSVSDFTSWDRWFNRRRSRNNSPTFIELFYVFGEVNQRTTIYPRYTHFVNINPYKAVFGNTLELFKDLYLFDPVVTSLRYKNSTKIKNATWVMVTGSILPRNEGVLNPLISKKRPCYLVTSLLENRKRIFSDWSKSKPGTTPPVIKNIWSQVAANSTYASWDFNNAKTLCTIPLMMPYSVGTVPKVLRCNDSLGYWPSPTLIETRDSNYPASNETFRAHFINETSAKIASLLKWDTSEPRKKGFKFTVNAKDIVGLKGPELKFPQYLVFGRSIRA